MTPSFRSSAKLVSTSAFALAILSLLSCGGSGIGDQDGWAPDSPAGYFIRIVTTTGIPKGTSPGVIQLNFTSDNEATVYASTVISRPFNQSMIATYIRTGLNSFTVAFNYKSSPNAPTTMTAIVDANCTLDRKDDNTNYIMGTAEWHYEGFGFSGGNSREEKGEGTGAVIEMGVGNPAVS